MNKIYIVAGPTAVGKTEYAIEIAKALDGEIVSSDSMQLYKYMDIGSAKPTQEELSQVPHHLVDEIDPREKFSVAKYQKLARAAIDDIIARGKTPVIAGGTGLYINSIIYDMDFAAEPSDEKERDKLYAIAEEKGGQALHDILKEADPEAAERIHPNNIKKMVRAIESAKAGSKVPSFENSFKLYPSYDPVIIGLIRDRNELYARVNRRVDILFEMGLVNEVKGLMEMGLDAADISMKGIGYKEVIGYLNNEYDEAFCIDLIQKNTRHLAKKQLTWLKRYEGIRYFNLSEYETKDKALEDILAWLRR